MNIFVTTIMNGQQVWVSELLKDSNIKLTHNKEDARPFKNEANAFIVRKALIAKLGGDSYVTFEFE